MPLRNFFFFSFPAECALWALYALSALIVGCSGDGMSGGTSVGPDGGRITVMTYNTQTFFDAVEDGTEFAEFIGTKSLWTPEKYEARLDRLREVILLCGGEAGLEADRGPDIVVLEEIENERVLRDLCNRFPRHGAYANAVFVPPDEGSAFGSAILTRYPIESLSVHSIACTDAVLRPLLEVRLTAGSTSLVVFAVHWKSKAGDDDTGEIRLLQEELLRDRIALLEAMDSGIQYIACGDFNQKLDEFTLMDGIPNCWDGWIERCTAGTEDGPAGSYNYRENWETIDHFFCSPGLFDGDGAEFSNFSVISEAPLMTAESLPFRYELFNGQGYSDHLPLVLVLE